MPVITFTRPLSRRAIYFCKYEFLSISMTFDIFSPIRIFVECKYRYFSLYGKIISRFFCVHPQFCRLFQTCVDNIIAKIKCNTCNTQSMPIVILKKMRSTNLESLKMRISHHRLRFLSNFFWRYVHFCVTLHPRKKTTAVVKSWSTRLTESVTFCVTEIHWLIANYMKIKTV